MKAPMLRNLRVLVIDDAPVVGGEIATEIDMITSHFDAKNATRWFEHCTSLATEKHLEYDLLSIDILFDRDETDPGAIFLPKGAVHRTKGYNCAGLYHGMIALARRRAADRVGNTLPLAWEVRSVSARLLGHPELKSEAVRAFGLLRSLLAQPVEGESLQECIYRESLQQNRLSQGEVNDSMPPPDSLPLHRIVLDDLVSLPPVVGGGFGMASRLLPKWRSGFKEALTTGDISIDPTELIELCKRLSRCEMRDKMRIISESYLPVAGWRRDVEYGIRLSSVFCDLVGGSAEGWEDILGEPDNSSAIYAERWLNEVCLSSGPVLADADFDRMAATVHFKAGAGGTNFVDWWKIAKPFERCFAYAVLLTRAQVAPNRFPESNDESLASRLEIPMTEKTFLAPFKRCRFGDCETAKEFRVELARGLRGDGWLLGVPWLKGALRRFCLQELKVSQSSLERSAPGIA